MTTNTEGNVPVYYYRGAVDNNVLFANFCWKIIRTTETGGVKLIYNGVQKDEYEIENIDQSSYTNVENDATYPYTFDSTNKTWTSTNKTDSTTGTITFTVAEAGYYVLSYTMSSEKNYDKALFYKNGTKLEEHSGTEAGTIALIGLTTTDIIKVEYTKDSSSSSGSDTVNFSIGKAVGTPIKSCNNTRTDSTIGDYQFNSNSNSPAYAGYMYNAVYTSTSKTTNNLTGTLIFGNDIDYDTSTNQYTLKDTYTLTDASNWSSEYTIIASKYHYTCLTSDNTCTSVYYINYMDSSYIYYFTLTNGKNHLDILEEMLSSDDINTKDSTIKTALDTWYQNNMTSHASELEDTVFCNDRGYDEKLNTSVWNKDNSANGDLYFNSYSRFESYKPSLVCSRQVDKFTVGASNGNGALTYPISLITADEAIYAGGIVGSYNSSYYLYNGDNYWLFSPHSFGVGYAYEFYLASDGYFSGYSVNGSRGVRPVVSLKPGIGFEGGSGTATDPFVIK